MIVTFTSSPSKSDVSAIYQGLVEFNREHFPAPNENSFGLFIHDEEHRIVGGLTGQQFFTSMHIRYLWLDESMRRQGFGRQLIERVEAEAKQRDILNLFIDTYSFQAPTFYENLGFRQTGRYNDYPMRGIDKIFYQKRLKPQRPR
ncbi:GNAT family N-acetyltransferase [Enterovibrio baiacu]|uniref:GNAT family N-acetyltransferase n=1 Tax=Enterovibrio baiacu TaxID=2491023 RepID=UPI003D1432BE